MKSTVEKLPDGRWCARHDTLGFEIFQTWREAQNWANMCAYVMADIMGKQE